MKRLNNKGITTIEVIICFILVVTISASMFTTISSFNQKRILEQYKEEIYTYKNLLTKEMQSDFITIGLTSAKYSKDISADGSTTKHILDCVMRDGTKRKLIVVQQFAKSAYHSNGSETKNDYYTIKYGPPDDLIDYPIPKFGFEVLDKGTSKQRTVQDFSINNVRIVITDTNVLDIYIGFYHPELTTRYGIQVICPINYVSSGRDPDATLIA